MNVLATALLRYRAPGWEPDDFGGSRILCAIDYAVDAAYPGRRAPRAPRDGMADHHTRWLAAVNLVSKLVLTELTERADADAYDPIVHDALGRNQAAAAWVIRLHEGRDLDDDAPIVIGEWEAAVCELPEETTLVTTWHLHVDALLACASQGGGKVQ